MLKNYVKISRCVENVYVRHVENRVENSVEIQKNHHHTLRCMLKLSGRGPKIRRQTARFDSEFTRVSEVRHIYYSALSLSSMSAKLWNIIADELVVVISVCKPPSNNSQKGETLPSMCSIAISWNTEHLGGPDSQLLGWVDLPWCYSISIEMSSLQSPLFNIISPDWCLLLFSA